MSAARFTVGGKVQGVWFRAATREQALKLAVSGYAKNLPDGRVEVLAGGTDEAIAALERWLWQGPPLAKVDSVARQDLPSTAITPGFETL
jgi:acylphosphatase